MTTDKFLLELKTLEYDKDCLHKIFNEVKDKARTKHLPWRRATSSSASNATGLVIQFGDFMITDPSDENLSCNLLSFQYISQLVNQLNVSHTIFPDQVDIIWYKPGFTFEPHVDHRAASTVMFPIFPEDGGAPIDFYYREDIQLEAGVAADFKKQLTSNDINHTHYYNTSYPTIFNSHWIHGVRTVDRDRAYLRVRLDESFSSIMEKFKKNILVKGKNDC